MFDSKGFKSKEYIINVGNNTYYGERSYVDAIISTGKSAMKNKFAIIGVEKSKVVQFLNEPHGDKVELDKAVEEYRSNGFRVYTA